MRISANPIAIAALSLFVAGLVLGPPPAAAQTAAKFHVKAVAEKRLAQLPPGPLYWRIENLPTLAKAEAAAGPTSLAAEAAGKAWLFTLGAPGGMTPGAVKVAEIGPVPPPPAAPEYLLRINAAGGPPGAKTPVHTHPGSETFYVVTGELRQRTPQGVMQVGAGQSMAGRAPGMAMEVSSTGAGELNALVMFVVDATKPFSAPSAF
jgi:quercetin dioxygenase-like cupin family protein